MSSGNPMNVGRPFAADRCCTMNVDRPVWAFSSDSMNIERPTLCQSSQQQVRGRTRLLGFRRSYDCDRTLMRAARRSHDHGTNESRANRRAHEHRRTFPARVPRNDVRKPADRLSHRHFDERWTTNPGGARQSHGRYGVRTRARTPIQMTIASPDTPQRADPGAIVSQKQRESSHLVIAKTAFGHQLAHRTPMYP